jgi:hypothetical protein
MFVAFVLYTNMAAVAKLVYGASDIVAGAFSMLLCLPLANYLLFRREKLIIDYVWLLMLAFLGISVASAIIMAQDTERALMWAVEFAIEGVVLYFLFLNVIRNLSVLKKVVSTLIFAGALMGSLSLYQEIFNAYSQTFGGLAQRSKDVEFEDEFYGDVYGQGKFFKTREGMRGANRSGGPIGKANRYAQIMLALMPLALFRFWGERNTLIKLFAGFATVFILSGFFLTYSRGGFVTLILMIGLLLFFRYVKVQQLLISLVVIVVLMAVAAPGYFNRIETIKGVEGLFSKSAEVRPDGTTRGRLTEMLAALMCFMDHPILGVGPGQYTPFYSIKYQSDPDIAFRFLDHQRRSHILYFEMAAETGFLGIGTFLAMVTVTMVRLWKLRRQAVGVRPDIANLATSLWFALVAYLGTAVFLHLSYQRYYWFLLALAGAAVQIFKHELQKEQQVDVQVVQENGSQRHELKSAMLKAG